MSVTFKHGMIGFGIIWLVGSIGSSVGHSNPPITHKVAWDSPRTYELFQQVCADCHSNETVWPWYSYIAPMSFVIVHHVNDGREHFNISESVLDEADGSASLYEEGDMPESGYLTFHPEANLSDDNRAALIRGLRKTFGPHEHHHDHDHDHGHHHHH